MKLIAAYFVQVFIALDQLANALIPPLDGTISYADETLSARAWRTYRDGQILGFFRWPIDILFFWQKWDMNHCKRAYEKEKERVGLPAEYRHTQSQEGTKPP